MSQVVTVHQAAIVEGVRILTRVTTRREASPSPVWSRWVCMFLRSPALR